MIADDDSRLLRKLRRPEMSMGLSLGVTLSGQSGPRPAPGYAFVTTNDGASFVTTNNGADRVQVRIS